MGTGLWTLIPPEKIETSQEAPKLGVTLEQKGIDFYAALKAMPGAEAMAADLSTLIVEEEGHLSKLSAMLGH